MTQELSSTSWDELCETISNGLTALAEHAEIENGGRARILFFAVAAYLDERGIIDGLKAAATYLQGSSTAKNAPQPTTHSDAEAQFPKPSKV